jgi:hypothetical protein
LWGDLPRGCVEQADPGLGQATGIPISPIGGESREYLLADVLGSVTVGVGGFARHAALPAIEAADYCEPALLVTGSPESTAEVAAEYDFVGDVGELRSVGGHSREWMEHTFTEEYADEVAETLYVNANTASDRVLDPDDFLHLDEVWRDGWDDEHRTILAETVTDRTISLHRDLDPERTIVHYMQPHTPFIPFPEVGSRQVTGPGIEGEYGKHVPELAEEYSREELWEFHMENLRYVLDSVAVLLSNVDAERVVLSSDHGQALGEEGVWGHPRGAFVDTVRKVPWVVTSATDSGSYEPDYDLADHDPGADEELSVD